MYHIVNEIADKYEIGDDVCAIIMKYIQINLFKDGWATMQSYDKQVKKAKRFAFDGWTARRHLPDRYKNYCYETIHKLYFQNPTEGFHKCVSGYGRLEQKMRLEAHREYKLYNMLVGEVSWSRQKIQIKTGFTKPELIEYIKNNTEYCLTNKLKNSFSKSQLLRIIIHEDPEGKIRK